MPNPSRRSPAAILASVILLAGCATQEFPGSTTSPTGAGLGASPPSSAAPSPRPSPSLAPSPTVLRISELPKLRSDGTSTLAVCDPAPGVALPVAIEALVSCSDGIEAGLRAIETVTNDAFDRVYLDLPTCDVAPCTREQLATGTVIAWTGSQVWSTTLDVRSGQWTATAPQPPDGAAWPTAAGGAAAATAPVLDHTPAEITGRATLPFCGQREMSAPAAVGACFVSSVLAGRPAEMFDLEHGTEGGTSLLVARFTGSGAIVIYQQHLDDQGRTGSWFAQLARLILGARAGDLTLDPISGTFRNLS